ncbi:hypothetical protein LGK97_01635 [Clostridium sp. CS001]|uniref:hypothetical protein n=1 Tax=Clostridium sp. CS001 TaxID=2880648 RepID=UPI001CF228C0|nr:hypothetical protein [Clostridium sp. CS001]MCB2288469.1 hypothetical protein [Clostridium sp. CS001]
MCNNRKFEIGLIISVILMATLSLNLISIKNKVIEHKNHTVFSNTIVKECNNLEEYGYSDILECLKGNSDLQIQSISAIENEKCNVEVSYSGDIKLLNNCLYYLSESRNFLGVNSIIINNDAKITSISVDFKKNK